MRAKIAGTTFVIIWLASGVGPRLTAGDMGCTIKRHGFAFRVVAPAGWMLKCNPEWEQESPAILVPESSESQEWQVTMFVDQYGKMEDQETIGQLMGTERRRYAAKEANVTTRPALTTADGRIAPVMEIAGNVD